MRIVEGVARADDLDAFLARIDEIRAAHGATVQAFDARYVVGRGHLERALELADRAIDRGESVAHDRAVEVLLYAAGRRQIDQALEMGVSEGECPVVVLVNGGDEADAAAALADLLDPEETLGAYEEDRVRTFFDVTADELAVTDGTLADVVLERVALLDVEK